MPKKLYFFLLSLILALSFILRVYGINYGLPLHLHPDEWSQIEPSLRMFNWDLNPHVFYYPSFLIYFLFIIFKMLNSLSPDVFKITASNEIFYFTGRFLSAIFGVFTVLTVYFLGVKLFDRKVALTSAFFFSISPFHIQSSHYSIVDTPMLLFICLTIYFCISIAKENRFKNFVLAGLAGGIASSTKYTAFLLIFIIYLAYLIHEYANFQEKGAVLKTDKKKLLLILSVSIFFLLACFLISSQPVFDNIQKYFSYKGKIEKGDLGYYVIEKIKFIFFLAGIFFLSIFFTIKYFDCSPLRKLLYINYLDKKIIFCIIIFITVLLLISPYMILDSKSSFRDIKFAFKVSALGYYENKLWTPVESQSSFMSYLETLISGNGLLLFIVSILGFITLMSKINLIPVFWTVIYFLCISSWKVSMSRFLLPVLPFMAIYSSGFIFYLTERLETIFSRIKNRQIFISENMKRLFAILLISVCSIVPFRNSAAIVKSFNEGSTLLESFNWIEKNMKEGSRILLIGDVPDLKLSDKKYMLRIERSLTTGSGYLEKEDADYVVIGFYKYNEAKVSLSLKLNNKLKLIEEIKPDEFKSGPIIRIYKSE